LFFHIRRSYFLLYDLFPTSVNELKRLPLVYTASIYRYSIVQQDAKNEMSFPLEPLKQSI
jgi:hypothetical protein